MFPLTLPLFSRPVAPRPALEINDQGVHRYADGQLFESIRWDDLAKVLIATTDEGPLAEDFYWLLVSHSEGGCAVPGALAQEYHLLEALQERLGEALDNMAIIEASSCTDNNLFVCFEAPQNGDATSRLSTMSQAP